MKLYKKGFLGLGKKNKVDSLDIPLPKEVEDLSSIPSPVELNPLHVDVAAEEAKRTLDPLPEDLLQYTSRLEDNVRLKKEMESFLKAYEHTIQELSKFKKTLDSVKSDHDIRETNIKAQESALNEREKILDSLQKELNHLVSVHTDMKLNSKNISSLTSALQKVEVLRKKAVKEQRSLQKEDKRLQEKYESLLKRVAEHGAI